MLVVHPINLLSQLRSFFSTGAVRRERTASANGRERMSFRMVGVSNRLYALSRSRMAGFLLANSRYAALHSFTPSRKIDISLSRLRSTCAHRNRSYSLLVQVGSEQIFSQFLIKTLQYSTPKTHSATRSGQRYSVRHIWSF